MRLRTHFRPTVAAGEYVAVTKQLITVDDMTVERHATQCPSILHMYSYITYILYRNICILHTKSYTFAWA